MYGIVSPYGAKRPQIYYDFGRSFKLCYFLWDPPPGKWRSQRKQMETHGKLQLFSKIHFFLRWEKIDGLFFFFRFFPRFIVSIGFRDTCILPHLHVWDPVTHGRYEASFWLVFEYHSALQFLVCFFFICFFFPGFHFVSLVFLIILYCKYIMYVRNELFRHSWNFAFSCGCLISICWDETQINRSQKQLIGPQPTK